VWWAGDLVLIGTGRGISEHLPIGGHTIIMKFCRSLLLDCLSATGQDRFVPSTRGPSQQRLLALSDRLRSRESNSKTICALSPRCIILSKWSGRPPPFGPPCPCPPSALISTHGTDDRLIPITLCVCTQCHVCPRHRRRSLLLVVDMIAVGHMVATWKQQALLSRVVLPPSCFFLSPR
jgi:hypothetical protein